MPEVVERKVNFDKVYGLKNDDREEYKLHLKRLENYKRVLLEERVRNNNDPLKHHIEYELTSTILLVKLIYSIIDQNILTSLPIAYILDERVHIPYNRFKSVLNGNTNFTQAEVNNAILFTVT
jgi:hypothetical protein